MHNTQQIIRKQMRNRDHEKQLRSQSVDGFFLPPRPMVQNNPPLVRIFKKKIMIL